MTSEPRSSDRKSESEPYLKSKNAVYLWSFTGANLAIFFSLLVSKGFAASSVEQAWGRVTAKDGIVATTIPLLTIVLSGVIGDFGKARLVFWRWSNPLPGCRAFTQLINTDPRIDVAALVKSLGEFPKEPKSQNALWYHLYQGIKADMKISEAHRIYLLTRDMATISVLFFALFSAGVIASPVNAKSAAVYVLTLLMQYVLVASAARNYGNRFVLNVLSEQSHRKGYLGTKG